MAILKVSSQTQLISALSTAKGGDTILLANGNYGSITIRNDFASTITIKAESALGAQFGKIGFLGATNVKLDGLQVSGGLAVEGGSKDIAVVNSDIDGTFYTRSVNGLTLDRVDISGGEFGVVLNTVQNFRITNSHIHDAITDLVRITGNSFNGMIENNVLSNTHATPGMHPDIIQFMHHNGMTPHDLIIRGNILHDAPEPGKVTAQGIFISDPGRGDQNKGYQNILIEDNLINTPAANTIFVHSGHSSVEILNNTLVSHNGGGGNIRLIGRDFGGPVIDGNVFKSLGDDNKLANLGDNFIYGIKTPVSTLFSGTNGADWKSYIPVKGSAIDFGSGYGAIERLAELIKTAGGKAPVGSVVTPPSTEVPQALEDQPEMVFGVDKAFEKTGSSKGWTAIKHDDDMEIDEGAISLTFNADTVAGNRGIISKGAAGNRDDFSAWIKNGKLIVAFENGKDFIAITKSGIKANTDYDLLVSFDNDMVQVWLDNTLVGQRAFDIDLSDNSEALVIGGVNGHSARGTTNKVHSFFDGTISNVAIYDEALTPSELAALDDDVHSRTLDDQGYNPAVSGMFG